MNRVLFPIGPLEETSTNEESREYESLWPVLGEAYLPIIRVDLILRGVHSNETDSSCELKGPQRHRKK